MHSSRGPSKVTCGQNRPLFVEPGGAGEDTQRPLLGQSAHTLGLDGYIRRFSLGAEQAVTEYMT